MATTTHPDTYAAALIVQGDVIEWNAQPWRVVAGRTTKVVRTLRLRHATLPNRTQVIRPRRDARIRMLAPIDSYHHESA